jgi:muconate cycloisomerase
MQVKKVELFEVVLPRRRPHRWATLITPIGQGYVILRITTDNGIEGWGEATVLPEWGGDFGRYFGESSGTVFLAISQHIFPSALKNCNPFDLEALSLRMHQVIKGHTYAKAAVEMALLDILGKATGQPVYNLLGGKVRDKIPVAHSLGLMDIQPALDEAKIAVDEGIKCIKVKGGLDVARDVELIRKLDAAFQGRIPIQLDGNQAYRSVGEVVRMLRQIEDCNIQFVEQPVAGIPQLAEIRSKTSIPVVADESVWSHYDALDAIQAKAVDYISIYVAKAGGLLPGKKVAIVAESASVLCNVNGSAEFAVGNAANLHMAACCQMTSLPCVISVTTIKGKEQTQVAGRFYQDDICVNPFKYDDGCLVVPDKPGLGVEIDMDKLKHYSTRQPLVVE